MPSDKPPMDRRVIWAWSLYDFGNSSFAVLFASMFSVYFKEHVVRPAGYPPDFWWSITITPLVQFARNSAFRRAALCKKKTVHPI